MRILFIGSKAAGYEALKLLIDHQADICGVVARPNDLDVGLWYPSVAQLAKQHNLPLVMPEDINSEATLNQLQSFAPDRIITVFYPQLFKASLIALPKKGCFNLHFAPLPRYRGCFPGAWAIINNEKQHGVTLHEINLGIDNGAIVYQANCDIASDETGFSLYDKCTKLSTQLLADHVAELLNADDLQTTPQDDAQALYYPRGGPFGGIVSWGWSAEFIARFVRALTFPPFKNPHTFIGASRLVLNKVEVKSSKQSDGLPGCVVATDPLEIVCGDGASLIIHDYDILSAKAYKAADLKIGMELGR